MFKVNSHLRTQVRDVRNQIESNFYFYNFPYVLTQYQDIALLHISSYICK
jgi:hypothetical protein